MSFILGISAFYHDSAAALLKDGEIVAACQEERLTRKRHDAAFPAQAIQYCLKTAGITLADVDIVIFYDKPFLKFERLLETYLQFAPRGIKSFLKAMPLWIKEKIFIKSQLIKELAKLADQGPDAKKIKYELLFAEHHRSHAAAAFFPSNCESAAVLCMDGVGEWATSSAWLGKDNKLQKLWEINFPHSLGLLYSAFTYYCGFKVNSGEYKLMGLAPYGEPKYADVIRKSLVDIMDDGSFALRMEFFEFATGLKMTSKKFDELFGQPARKPESNLTQFHMDLASSIQVVTEEIVLKLAASLKKETGLDNICLSGGVALNCVANGKLAKTGLFKNIWVQPASGDAGSALGAAYCAWFEYLDKKRTPKAQDSMQGAYLGPQNTEAQILETFKKYGAKFEKLSDDGLVAKVAERIADGAVIGWCQGRSEFGPRALGARSIIADPRHREMQSKLNLKIKFRESFRPFAPAVLAERVSDIFDYKGTSPYMLMVAPVKEEMRAKLPENYEQLFGIDKLNVPRSKFPSITHVDYSARLQTVHKETNPRFHALISKFDSLTGCPVLVNTSFNVRGEPIVNTAEEAYRCFMRTEMDYLIVENYFLDKKDQPKMHESTDWRNEYALD